MVGAVIGLIVGVAVVVGVVMYFSRAGTPFTNLQKIVRSSSTPVASAPAQALSPGMTINEQNNTSGPAVAPPAPTPAQAGVASAPVATAAVAAQPKPKANTKPANTDQDGQRFDFYKILPGQVDAVSGQAGVSASAAHQAGAAPRKTFLQLGSFQDQDDADNLKAKLALLGIEATIQSVDVPGKGLVHRVKVGPFATPDDVARVRAQLKQNGINLVSKASN
jgi:cell division protein FtsN